MKSISIKGVLIGSVSDIVLTNILTVPLLVYIIVDRIKAGIPADKVANSAFEIIHSNPIYYVLSLALGTLCSILGGYIAARIAKRSEVLNGAFSSILCIGFGIYGAINGVSRYPLLYEFLFFISSVLLGAFGGFIRQLQLRRPATN